MLGTSNRTVLREVQNAQQQNFKTVNNLLTLQENHVEEFLNIMVKISCLHWKNLWKM